METVAHAGYLSQSDPRPHFGLGQHTKADKVTIHWPSGAVQTLENVAADQILTVIEPPVSGMGMAKKWDK